MTRPLLKAVPLGLRFSLPVVLLLLVGFAAPLLAVVGYSFVEPRTFALLGPEAQGPTLANYRAIFNPANTVYTSFVWSLLLAAQTVVILVVVCWPIAYGLSFLFGRFANLVTLAFVMPLFISENVRLYGWVLFFIKGGVLDGTFRSLFGVGVEAPLFTPVAIVFGMVYVYLPFMLFPMTLGLSMVPKDLKDAAFDLGASRFQVFREVELPLAMPGLMIGALLTFVLAVGAVAEAKVLGGQSIIVITHDIEIAFTYAQNWPMGAALSVLLMLVVGSLVVAVLRYLDLDRILGRARS
ncbi:ABC transporter permease [Zavarzinia sp. CC-PAN008]|uniref:ABC transporter permease n=1 Tax=Zavarzinia sp. CC-PAN008 TaxID=3243332 RepID=UPI003F74216A